MRVSVVSATVIMLLVSILLQGCGHKGPLVLPPPQNAPQQSDSGAGK